VIPFNKPSLTGKELFYIADAVIDNHLSGDGKYTQLCHQWFEETLPCNKALFTHSCTAALEMSAILCDIKPGDEVIMPSFTFVSTANAFVLRGAKIVFVDIREDTLNINESLIEEAITDKTKAIVPVHYAGVSCEMDSIMSIARKHNLFVIEDAAQAMMSSYKGKALGTIGDLGTFSFHETKNYNCGEGGALLINNLSLIERAEIIREKGTNRSRFFRGEVDKYTWVDIGSSYLPSELNAAYLFAQLENSEKINNDRKQSWGLYYDGLKSNDKIGIPIIHPKHIEHNAHNFFIKTKDIFERNSLISYLKKNEISGIFHYIPLHSSPAGKIYGRVSGKMDITDDTSNVLIRLPMYFGLSKKAINSVINCINKFYQSYD